MKMPRWTIGWRAVLAVAAAVVAVVGVFSNRKKDVASGAFVAPITSADSQSLLDHPEIAIANAANKAAVFARAAQGEDGPAEGYAKNQWQQTVAAGRGQVLKDMGPINPKMNVLPEGSVQVLGAPPVIGK